VTDDRRVLRDRELVDLLADEPELLAILDAYASTQRRQRIAVRTPVRRLLFLAAALVIVAVPAVAFADQIGQILGLSNPGSPVATGQLPPWQLSALQSVGFPTQGVRLLGDRDGTSFYVSKQPDGNYCFGIGFAPAVSPRIDALACGDQLGTFPSANEPIADLSGISTSPDGSIRVNKLAGFATDAISRIELINSNGDVVEVVPVADNIYAANPANVPVAAIAAVDQQGKIIYEKKLEQATPPPPPQPSQPSSPTQTSPDRTPTP
jgi:hypothetical protein